MKGTAIIVLAGSGSPRGFFDECLVNGTPYPGTVMEMDDTIPAVGGRFTWQPYGTTGASGGQGVSNNGDRKIIAILTEKRDDAGVFSTQYADGDRGFLYFPSMGEQFNMLMQDILTDEFWFIGEEFMIHNSSGQLLSADNNAEAHPFTCLERISKLAVDVRVWTRFNGSAG